MYITEIRRYLRALDAEKESLLTEIASEDQQYTDSQTQTVYDALRQASALSEPLRKGREIDFQAIANVLHGLPRGDALSTPVGQMHTLTLRYVMCCLYSTVLQRFIASAAVLDSDIDYYESVSQSTLGTALYAAQTLPGRVVGLCRSTSVRDHLIKNNLVSFHKLLGPVRQWSPLALVGAPMVGVLDEVKGRASKLVHAKHHLATKLGVVLQTFDLGKQNVSVLLHAMDKETKGDLQQQLQQLCESMQIPPLPLKPGILARYWPGIALFILYGPAALRTAVYNVDSMFAFFQDNIIGTVKAFMTNWVIQPLRQIFSTIRHDNESTTALMSQNSLQSDLDSLTRMVIAYSIDNNAEFHNLPPESRAAAESHLAELIERGDLTSFMTSYEGEIKSPLKNIIMGDLIRALLIQLQKTKVDSAIAINGIDKLLKSQQLVFGVVAASPSFLVLFYVVAAIRSYINRGVVWRNVTKYKIQIAKQLSVVESLCNRDVDAYTTGLLLLETVSLTKAGTKVLPKTLRARWIADLEELILLATQQQKLNVVRRLYNVYGAYIT